MKPRGHLGNRLQFQTRTIGMSTHHVEPISRNISEHNFHKLRNKGIKELNPSYNNKLNEVGSTLTRCSRWLEA